MHCDVEGRGQDWGVDVKKVGNVRGSSTATLTGAGLAVLAFCLVSPGLAGAAAEGSSVKAGLAEYSATTTPEVSTSEPMMLALEDQSIGDETFIVGQHGTQQANTTLAGLTSLAALRERMREAREVEPAAKPVVPLVLQVGSFASRDNAARLESELAGEFKTVYVTQSQLSGRQLFRVRVGSFSSMSELESAERMLRARGHTTWRLHSVGDSQARQAHSSR